MVSQTKKPLSLHLGLALAEIICGTAFTVELMRALNGNLLSWAYVFEWPILGTYAVYMWHKLLYEDDVRPTAVTTSDEDAALEEFNAYLAQVHDGCTPDSTDGFS